MIELILLSMLSVQDGPSVDDEIVRFKAAYKNADPSARTSAVKELAKIQDKKILSRLGALTVADVPAVRIEAAKGLGTRTEKKDQKRAVAYLLRALAPNRKEPTVVAALLTALGELKHPAAAREISRHFKSREVVVAKAAVEAAGKIRARESIGPLVDLLRHLEEGAKEVNTGGGGGGGKFPGLGGGGVVDRNARQRHQTVTPLVHAALRSITRENISNRKDWEMFWKTYARSFRVPD